MVYINAVSVIMAVSDLICLFSTIAVVIYLFYFLL